MIRVRKRCLIPHLSTVKWSLTLDQEGTTPASYWALTKFLSKATLRERSLDHGMHLPEAPLFEMYQAKLIRSARMERLVLKLRH